MSKIVPVAAYQILSDYPQGLSAKRITEEIQRRRLHPLAAKKPEEIVARALNRHCKGVDRSYSCQEKYFTMSKDSTGTTVYKNIPNALDVDAGISEYFVYPSHQIAAITNSDFSRSNTKTRIMDAENQTIRNVLAKYCFFVPDYQRSYSWKAPQIDEFLDDIYNIIHSDQVDARHFLGAITMSKHSNHQGEVDLIDGQQRITTIFIFLYVILSEYKSARFADKAQGRAEELLRKLAYLDDDGERAGSRLVLGSFNREFFENYVVKSYDKTDEERENIKTTYKERNEYNQNQAIFEAFNKIKISVEERLDCCDSEDTAYEYLKALQMCLFDRFELVTMTVEEEADAFLIFETLNDRGLVLSAVDLIKNKLFQSFSTRSTEFDALKAAWESMCDNIENKDDIKKYLLHFWRSKYGYVSPQNLYKACRDYLKENGFASAKAIVKDLSLFSKYYNGFCNPMSAHSWNSVTLKTALNDMNKLGYDLAHPILLSALRKYPHDEEKLATVVRLCLNFLIRYISVLKNKPTSIEKEISRWACDPDFSIEMLKEHFEEKAPDSKFTEVLQNISIPYKSPLAHYLLCVYEAEGFNRREYWSSPGRWNNTIEHVLPQDVNSSTEGGQYWITQFGNRDTCELYQERLGNYAFLTPKAQSKASNYSFGIKKAIYSDESDMRLTKELSQYDEWNADSIIARQKRMSEVLTSAISFVI